MHITRRNPIWPGSPRRTGRDFAVDEHGFPITTSTQPVPLESNARVHNATGLPRDEFGDTFSDGREIEAAHAASEHTEADDFLTVNQTKARARARLLAALTAVGALLLVWVLASAGPL